LPIYGTLRPSEAEQITLTFYGHSNIVSEALALCEVEGGPTYEILFKGEASLVSYKFDFLEIDYNKIVSRRVVRAVNK
jgi:hydrocephalus-inducing protein